MDFDVDYEDQDAVFDDLVKKYGEDSVARIVAFGTLSPRACIRKVFSVFEHDMATIKSVTSLVPDLTPNLAQAIKDNPMVHTMLSKYPREYEVIKRLEGIVSHESQHAGGVIIYPQIAKYAPVKTLRTEPRKRIVAWDKYMLEDLGWFKHDVLGLKTLPILNSAVQLIKEHEGLEVNLPELVPDDPDVYAMLCKGDVSGVFQLSNQAEKVVQQQPVNFKDLIAINALVRPGVGDWSEYLARRFGKEFEIYPPRLRYMEETFGTMTYQEQFMLDAHILAGWDIAYADKVLRKNKNIRNDTETKQKFIKDGISNGHDESTLREIWEEIEDAVDGGYSFNKSHSAAYAQISYQTAWLKVKYPQYFYCAVMNAEKGDSDGQEEISKLIYEIKQRGIRVLPPSINKSTEKFEPTKEGIAFRITTIKKVGENAVESIKGMRPIHSFEDFLERRDTRKINKGVIVNLIKAGCFDEFNPKREELLWELEMSGRTKTQIKNDVQLPKIEINPNTYMDWEMEVLGLYISSHPMEKYGFKDWESYPDGEYGALCGGKVTDRRVFNDKKGNEMAFITIDSLYGKIKVICFASSWTVEWAMATHIGNNIMVKGKKQGKDIIANHIEVLE